ncbi:tetratricopeptide repeat protein [Deinococcus taeanensis]|uniref:tetratricopeptide repeat protein n=1 Tax=Deinococcus taeanensis TaxID=2737050 RepID=UPI001CDD1D30|nr:tetratricopeptide repeat protein [Deinococcus taeanensis]UBV42509.1 tetratricopeptide repeat protein [Deinococcus taeanensis]
MRSLTLLLALTGTLTAHAQTTPGAPSAPAQAAPQSAAAHATTARTLAERARAAYPRGSANIDQPLWKQAAAAAEAAVAAAPDNADFLKLRAEIYTEVRFWRQAELAWNAYFKVAPATQNAAEATSAANVQYNLGYAAYTRNQPDQAAAFFQTCLTLDPRSAQCAAWAARTALEAGNYTQAQTLYDRALSLNPGDKTLTYFRSLSVSAAQYGPAATRAFSRAYGELDAGRKAQALAGFQEAARSAPNFADAQREAGRLALELGNPQAALEAYTALSALPKPTAADRYNLTLAQEAQTYGLTAVRTYRAAYARYAAGDRTAAETGFQAATQQNPRYAKAWAWLGRVRYERKDYAGASAAYMQAVALDPNDKSSAYYLKLSQQGK